VAKFGLAHISAGDLLRAEVAAGTAAGMRAKEFMDRGDLVPDEARAPLAPRCLGFSLWVGLGADAASRCAAHRARRL
jgi:hypothetical protein